MVLPDKLVSEWHAVVSTSKGIINYVDLGSTNGSLVDGVEITSHAPVILQPLSSVVVGSRQLTFSLTTSEAVAEHSNAAEDAKTNLFSGDGKGRPGGGPPNSSCPLTRVGPSRDSPPPRPNVPPLPPSQGRSVMRERRLLLQFAQAFVELRQCRLVLCRDLGIPTDTANPLDACQSADQLLDCLLRRDEDRGDASKLLTEAFSNQAAHQIGVVTGVVAGVRSILTHLSPNEVSKRNSGAASNEVAGSAEIGLLDMLVPFRLAALWRSYTEAHNDLMQEDHFVEQLFGTSFSEAYRMVVKEGSETPNRLG